MQVCRGAVLKRDASLVSRILENKREESLTEVKQKPKGSSESLLSP